MRAFLLAAALLVAGCTPEGVAGRLAPVLGADRPLEVPLVTIWTIRF